MSFLKNLRSSVSRKNSERSKIEDSSVFEKKYFSKISGAQISISKDIVQDKKVIIKESQSEGIIRSDTYTIIDETGKVLINEHKETESTAPPKQSMFSKFGTFTKMKKAQPQNKEPDLKEEKSYTDTNYKSDIVTHNQSSDPFNIFYQQSVMHSRISSDRDPIEYGTYRKSKLPNNIRDQLEELHLKPKPEEKPYDDPDKYKTVTLKSFRKSFRDKFLAQQKDVPYNPSWFVEVDQPKDENKEEDENERKRRALLVFENENYRPSARSPIRNVDRSPSRSKTPVRSPSRRSSTTISGSRSRSKTRSSLKKSIQPDTPQRDRSPHKPVATVKRNETFRIERESPKPSIRIEIKNSISPNEPGRIVPVGVAKPMPYSNPDGSYKSNSRPSNASFLYGRSGSTNRNRNYQTTIHITPESLNAQPSSSRKRSERPENYSINRLSTSRPESSSRAPAVQVRTSRKSNPIVENYLPLTSYELLTKMKPQSSSQAAKMNLAGHHTIKDSSRSSGKFSEPENFHSYASKRRNEPSNSVTSKQKSSIYIGDSSPVCKDASYQNGSNKKRLRLKLPWR